MGIIILIALICAGGLLLAIKEGYVQGVDQIFDSFKGCVTSLVIVVVGLAVIFFSITGWFSNRTSTKEAAQRLGFEFMSVQDYNGRNTIGGVFKDRDVEVIKVNEKVVFIDGDDKYKMKLVSIDKRELATSVYFKYNGNYMKFIFPTTQGRMKWFYEHLKDPDAFMEIMKENGSL